MQKALISLFFILLFSGIVIAQDDAPCAHFSVSNQTIYGPSAGTHNVVVSTFDQNCQWTATVNYQTVDMTWVTLNIASGRGTGGVQFTLSENKGPERIANIGITNSQGGSTGYRIRQVTGCPNNGFPISPMSVNFPKEGGTGSFFVDVGDRERCFWGTVSELDEGIRVTSIPLPAITSGSVNFTVSPNTGPARTLRIREGDAIFTVNQANGCAPTVSNLTSPVVLAAGGNLTVSVSTPTGCTWSANVLQGTWLTLSGVIGNGSANVTLTIPPNTGWSRVSLVQIAGKFFEITQGEGCTYNLLPSTLKIPSTGGSFNADLVSSDPSCRNFISNSTGNFFSNLKFEQIGNTSISFTAAPNTSSVVRTATITFGGARPEFYKTIPIIQNDKCADENRVMNAIRLCRAKKQIPK